MDPEVQVQIQVTLLLELGQVYVVEQGDNLTSQNNKKEN